MYYVYWCVARLYRFYYVKGVSCKFCALLITGHEPRAPRLLSQLSREQRAGEMVRVD